MAGGPNVDTPSRLVDFLNAYAFRVEPDAVLPCEPRSAEPPPLQFSRRHLCLKNLHPSRMIRQRAEDRR